MLETAGEGIVVCDHELRYRVWNRFMEDHLGLLADAVAGRVAYELFPYLVEGGVVPFMRRALAGERVQTPEYRFTSPYNGRAGWATSRFEPYHDDAGAIVGVIGHVQDVTERKRFEEALRESEVQFRTIIESAGDIVAILDASGVTRYVSPALESTLGLRADEVIGQNPIERIHPDDQALVLDAFRTVVRAPAVHRPVQYRSRHANGSWRTLMSSARNLIDDPTVRGIVVSSRDVTEWVELQSRLTQSQRIEAVGRLAGGVAHDFNNLLTVIRGNAQLLLTGGEIPVRARDELDEIAQAADRAATLTRQLLAFSRQQVLQPRVLNLNEVLADVRDLLARLVGEAVALELQADASLGQVTADPAQVEQVLLNLTINARDAMPHGGRLVIETANVAADAGFALQHRPMPPGEYVRLTVRDSGVGMDATTMARAFDPFFTTKAPGHGIGMGLSTVYGVVKQSGGFIWIDSAVGEGSTFTIYLPRCADAALAIAPRRVERENWRGSETILVAEDEVLVRAMTRRTLERAGYQVYEAGNGVEALVIARSLGDRLHLLLTDIVMPEMGGRELAATLRLERPSLSILFMSGYTQERDAHLSAGGGITHFLHKPFTLDELRGRVRVVLDQLATSAA